MLKQPILGKNIFLNYFAVANLLYYFPTAAYLIVMFYINQSITKSLLCFMAIRESFCVFFV